MAEKLIAGFTVDVNEEGYLTNPAQWNKEIAVELAKEVGIEELTERHWKVIEFLQKDFQENGKLPTIRRVNKVGGISTKELYELYPDGPLVKAAKVAGLSKPASCV
ncbi:TusE/DsrC/DsvC family sulfur relay protein [Tepidibacillus infernus]|uniref:Sulfur relay protein DsrC n=1 Tax=Tepidibacillus decaturensis TaxID=1413211 RepID=A0A135L3J7_9BACI|nr:MULTISPECIES: TusE/DsrC/DsvC family sulfur relay protein [Tepidibacillus]KXG43521.1 sulfur relay protein DsrC [Tepidibacillus decaturensis]GBF12124.1 sulfite reductase, dissimilatory-type subunit gamma [Tepidibacillus sp. HK-1]